MSPYEFDSFLEVINIRTGGLAIYGGLICGVLAIIGVCYVKKKNLWRVLDMIAPGVMIAQALGRWGNFMNAEAYGGLTRLPWRMCSPKIAAELRVQGIADSAAYAEILDGTLGVHPTFLYESLWNLLGFVLINLFYKKKKYNGQIFLCYVTWYGFGRMWIEGLRTDSLYLGPFRVSQLVAFLSFAFALGYAVYLWIRNRKTPVTDLCRFCTADKKRIPEEALVAEGTAAEGTDAEASADTAEETTNDTTDADGSSDASDDTQ